MTPNIQNETPSGVSMAPWSRPVFNLNHRGWTEIRQRYPAFRDWRIDLRMRTAGRLFSLLGAAQRAAFRARLAQISIARPVFILGHWRSGTSLLHELLALNENFASPTTFACFNPHNFLLSPHPLGDPSADAVQRPTRDLMVSADSPQEEEFALLCLGVRSGYEAFMFPRAIERIEALCDPAQFPHDAREFWDAALMEFLRGISYATGPEKRLLLKSPTNSFRVEALHRLFPDASFVVLSRDPVSVFKSTIGMWMAMWDRYALAPHLGQAELEEQVLRARLALEGRLEAGLAALPPASSAAVGYEQLIADACGTIRGLYEKLELDDYSLIEPRVRRYMETHRRTARERPLPPQTVALIYERWKSIFEKYDYRCE